MIPWKNRLEFRILLLSIVLPLAGVLAVSLGALIFLKAGLVDIIRTHSEASAAIITRSIEKLMINGRPEMTRPVLDGLSDLSGVEEVRLLSLTGDRLSSPPAGSEEGEAIERLRRAPRSFAIRSEGRLVFYQPLLNNADCRSCHADEGALLGVAKVSISLREAFQRLTSLIGTTVLWALAGIAGMGILLWWVTRRLVVLPVQGIHRASASLADGDLTVEVPIFADDEIGMLGRSFRESQRTLSTVITRINSVAARVAEVSGRVEGESAQVVEATGAEADSFGHIASSMEELNASTRTISENIGELTLSVQRAHESSQEVAAVNGEIFRNIDDLSGAVEDATATTGEMSHTIRELNWGASQLSAVSKDILSAIESLENFISGVKDNAHESARHSEQVRREADELGTAAVRNTIRGMEKIQGAVRSTSTYVTSLGGMSKQIGEVVDVIDEVTDQTALLALNAAILAAQAGERGKGFQVVAAEIRKLAVRSAKSTVEISELIGSVRKNVDGAVQSMDEGLKSVESGFDSAREAEGALDKIVSRAGESMEKSAIIHKATEEQSATLASVRETMEKLDAMAQFLAQGTEEQKREAAGISRSAEEVKDFVSQIRTAGEEQLKSSRSIEKALEEVSEGTRQMSKALEDEHQGSAQIMAALTDVVDLPGRTRSKAIRINQGLRGILNDTELLSTEVRRFKVLKEEGVETLRLGVVPLESPAEMFQRFTPLAQHLSQRLGKKVELKVALDFKEALADLGEGRTHIAYLTPSTYVKAKERYGVLLIAKALRDGKPFQHSVIVTSSATGITSPAQLRGRTFAFGDPHSTSSHIVPRAMLEEEGISLDGLGGHAYLGHHDDVAKAVLNGEYDAGAVMESVAHRYAAKGLVFIATSPPIPEFNFCSTAAVSARDRGKVQEALLELSREDSKGRRVLEALAGGQTGFTTAEDGDYRGIAEMMKHLDMGDGDDNSAVSQGGLADKTLPRKERGPL